MFGSSDQTFVSCIVTGEGESQGSRIQYLRFVIFLVIQSIKAIWQDRISERIVEMTPQIGRWVTISFGVLGGMHLQGPERSRG